MMIESKVKLTRISSSHQNLRTDEVIGFVKKVPELFYKFMMISEPLDKTKNFRWIETTPITSIDISEDGIFWKVKTGNSEYLIEILEL